MNLIVTLSPSVNLSGGAGIVPLNVQVFTTFPGAISSSASCAIRVYSFLAVVGGVIVDELLLLLVLVVASASVGPLICVSLSIPTILENGIRIPTIPDATRIPHSIMVRARLFELDNLFDISY